MKSSDHIELTSHLLPDHALGELKLVVQPTQKQETVKENKNLIEWLPNDIVQQVIFPYLTETPEEVLKLSKLDDNWNKFILSFPDIEKLIFTEFKPVDMKTFYRYKDEADYVIDQIKQNLSQISHCKLSNQIKLCGRILDVHGREKDVKGTYDPETNKGNSELLLRVEEILGKTLKNLEDGVLFNKIPMDEYIKNDNNAIKKHVLHHISEIQKELYLQSLRGLQEKSNVTVPIVLLRESTKYQEEEQEVLKERCTKHFTYGSWLLICIATAVGIKYYFDDYDMMQSLAVIPAGIGLLLAPFWMAYHCGKPEKNRSCIIAEEYQAIGKRHRLFEEKINRDVFPPESARDLWTLTTEEFDPKDYKGQYVFVNNKNLYYIDDEAKKEPVRLEELVKFQRIVKHLTKEINLVHLTGKQVFEIITMNGGHKPTETKKGDSVRINISP